MNRLNVVLLEPEIPQNTGNIARTCVATHTALHLIEPFGFKINDKNLKRAGLDYWQYLEVFYYKNIDEFYEKHPNAKCRYFTTKGQKCYSESDYSGDCYLFFGKETKGLPEDLL
ncbi:MAG: tRNA (cytidine(34)-2'-O)-methyltransferase, partial [Clostridia bacterium]